MGQLRGTLRTNERVVESTFRPRLDDPAFGDAEIADNDGEKIVEIVRNSSGQLTDGLHLLGLPESLLGKLAAFGFRVKGSRAAHRQQHKHEEKSVAGIPKIK